MLLLLRRLKLAQPLLSLIQPLKEMNFQTILCSFLHLSMTFVSILSGIRILIISLVFGLTKIRSEFLPLDLFQIAGREASGRHVESYRNRS